jgi:hypothetical protein
VSNVTFLQQDWPELYETAREAEQNVNSAPRTSCFYARRSLERAVKWLYANDSYLKQTYADNSGLYRTWERIYCENISPVHLLVNSRQIGPLFALEFPKICPRPAVLSRRFPKSDRLLAALIHEPTFRENLEPCLFPKSKWRCFLVKAKQGNTF